MNSFKELVDLVYSQIKDLSLNPELNTENYISLILETTLLEKLPSKVPSEKLDEFLSIPSQNLKESIFKQYVPDYASLLEEVKSEFLKEIETRLFINSVVDPK